MSVFTSNTRSSGSVMSDAAFAERRANIAAIHRERLAKDRADAANKRQRELIERYHAVLAFKEAHNGMPIHLAEQLERTDLTPAERATIEDEVTAIVAAERVVSFRLNK